MRHHNSERISVIYFERRDGKILIAPDHRHPTPSGYERKECHTLAEIDALTRKVNLQDKSMFDGMMGRDLEVMQATHDRIRTKLRQRLLAADCSRFERLFIQRSFMYLDKKEKELQEYKYRGYFQQREFDSVRAGTENYGKQVTAPKLSDRLASVLSQ